MKATSYIEISKSALEHNIAFIRKVIGNHCELSSVVKGNAYGHGIENFVPLAEECGIKHFSVFSSDEAYRVLHSMSKNSSVMIMGCVSEDEIIWVIKNNIEFFISGAAQLQIAVETARKLNTKALIHLELETGLNRTGIDESELGSIFPIIKNDSDHLILCGTCTHFAGAESISNYLRIRKQTVRYLKMLKSISSNGIHVGRKHIACSAATIIYPKSILDMARIGIMQYGYWPSNEVRMQYLSQSTDKTDPLKRVITWKTYISGIKKVRAGEFIGYGSSVLAESDMKIATIPVGYANGYSRSLSNLGKVLIKEKRADVIGIINMNVTMVNVTHLKNVKSGDEVVLIGNQGEMAISVASFSEMSNQLNYELLTRLPYYIPKLITL